MTLLSRVGWTCATALALSGLVGCRFEGNYGVTPYVHNLARATLTVQVRELRGVPTCPLL